MDLAEALLDIEDGDQITDDLNEEDLLGSSDDEDKDAQTSTRCTTTDPPIITEGQESKEVNTVVSKDQISVAEHDEDFLDLALGDEDDGLDLANDNASSPFISPVKVKVLKSHAVSLAPPDNSTSSSQSIPTSTLQSDGDSQAEAESEDVEHDDDLSESTKTETGDDDDDEEKEKRSRFVSERPTTDGPKSSSYFENAQPIRTLGHRFRGQFNYGGMRGSRPPGHLQMRQGFPHQHMNSMMNHHRNLVPQVARHSGNRPDYRAPGPEIPVSQCSGQIFIDFNQPIQGNQNQTLSLPPISVTPREMSPATALQVLPSPAVNKSPPNVATVSIQVAEQIPTTLSSPPKQCVAIRPQQQQHPLPSRLSAPGDIGPRQPSVTVRTPRNFDKPKRNPVFPPMVQRGPFPMPPQEFPPFPPPQVPMFHQQMFMPQQNFPPNFGYAPPPPGMMVMGHPGGFDLNRFPGQGPRPMWGGPQVSHYGPPSFQGMPHGFFSPQQFPPQMNPFPPEPHFVPQPNPMAGLGGFQNPMARPFEPQPTPPVSLPPPRDPMVMDDRRDRDWSRYDRDRDSYDDRYYDDYRRRRSKRHSDSDSDEEYRQDSKHYRRERERSRYDDSSRRRSRSVSKERSTAPAPVVDPKVAELAKIIGETKKEMGIDDAYMAKIEEQKRLREAILRKKGKKGSTESGSGFPSVVPPPKPNSIYINPAFKGDPALLVNDQLKRQEQGKDSGQTNTVPKRKVGVPTSKPKIILRKILSSSGTVIRMEKLCKVKKTKKPSQDTTLTQ